MSFPLGVLWVLGVSFPIQATGKRKTQQVLLRTLALTLTYHIQHSEHNELLFYYVP